MTNVNWRARGVSLVELLMGLAASSVVLGGSLAVMLQVNSMQSNDRLQSLINQNYFLGLQIANHARRFTTYDATHNPLGITAALENCLANAGTSCRALDGTGGLVPNSIDSTMNVGFNLRGPCDPDADPSCLVKRTTRFTWECPDAKFCSGLRLDLRVEQIHPTIEATPVKPRVGTVTISSRQFQNKAAVRFHCGGTHRRALIGIDYDNLTDVCSTYDPGAACAMPMAIYGTASNCQPPQDKSCPTGFDKIGLFREHGECIADAPLPETKPSLACPPGQTILADNTCGPVTPKAPGWWMPAPMSEINWDGGDMCDEVAVKWQLLYQPLTGPCPTNGKYCVYFWVVGNVAEDQVAEKCVTPVEAQQRCSSGTVNAKYPSQNPMFCQGI